jgi:hypothetical protein
MTIRSNQGRHYSIGEWVEFVQDGYLEGALQETDIDPSDVQVHISKKMQAAADRFTKEANRVVRGWAKAHPDNAHDLIESDAYESDHDIAWNTWAAFEGHGVGFWEDMDDIDWGSLERAIKGDKKLRRAFDDLQEHILISTDEAVENA